MPRKLTILVADDVYDGLYAKVGPRKIGKFLEGLARPHVVDYEDKALAKAYAEAASDEAREREAAAWCEAGVGETLPRDPLYDGLDDADRTASAASGARDADASR